MIGSRSENGPKIAIFPDFSENFKKIPSKFLYKALQGSYRDMPKTVSTDFALVYVGIVTATIGTFITVSQTRTDNKIFIAFLIFGHTIFIAIHFVHQQLRNCDVYYSTGRVQDRQEGIAKVPLYSDRRNLRNWTETPRYEGEMR